MILRLHHRVMPSAFVWSVQCYARFDPIMQSSLIPERPLIVSPTLAATIGLEEAVMLHVLSECMTHRKLSRRVRLDWVEIDQQTFTETLEKTSLFSVC